MTHSNPNDEPIFTRGPARRPAPPVVDPVIQWATGLPTTRKAIYAGWLIESHKSESLDDALLAAGFDCVNIRHGSGNVVEYWTVETANLFFIAEGVQSIGEMGSDPTRHGIAFGWRTLPGGRRQSQLRARVLLRELLEVGYTDPLLLTLKGTLTGDLIGCLTRHYDTLDAINPLRAKAGKGAIEVPFYGCSIPLGPGAEVTRGSGGASKEITPMIDRIGTPLRDHIQAHWIKRAWVAPIEDRLDATIAWSITESAAIAEDGAGE
jgi:hypothetical protein